MNLIPFEKLTFVLSLNMNEVQAKLQDKTEVWQNQTLRVIKDLKTGSYSDPTRFEIKIVGNRFTLRRINDRFSHNGMRPIVKGLMESRDEGTRIQLTIRQQATTIFGLVFWSAITLLVALSNLGSDPVKAIPGFLFFCIGYFFILFGYNSEIKFYTKFLHNTFGSNLK